jgi:hypothetical protein
VTDDGKAHPLQLEPEASLRQRNNLAGVSWFILPTLGPPRARVRAIEFGAERRRVNLEQQPAGSR